MCANGSSRGVVTGFRIKRPSYTMKSPSPNEGLFCTIFEFGCAPSGANTGLIKRRLPGPRQAMWYQVLPLSRFVQQWSRGFFVAYKDCAKVIGIHTVCAPLPCLLRRVVCPRGAAVAGRLRCSRSGLRQVVLPPALFLVRL